MKNLLFLLALSSVFVSQSQNELDLAYHLPNNVKYNLNIPTPESVIGHHVGEWHITHDKSSKKYDAFLLLFHAFPSKKSY